MRSVVETSSSAGKALPEKGEEKSSKARRRRVGGEGGEFSSAGEAT